MRGRINRLSSSLIDKIAAGEVIERPASVVKELVENALDAQAERVRVDLKAGGKEGIIVSDDGHGMGADDLELCIERHATSKIQSPGDLFAIETLGFRGEALPSIAGVSHLSIESLAAGEVVGNRLVVEGGVRRVLEPIARDRGTMMSVRHLFFNTPARRKFLRQNETEARHTTQVLVNLAAAYPKVHFELWHNQRRTLLFRQGDDRTRAAELLNVSSEDLAAVDFELGAVHISGYVLLPHRCQAGRGKQFLMVRSRPVKNRKISDAITEGYGGFLSVPRQPAYVLNVVVPANRVDVNVHPAKREVRFADENEIVGCMLKAVRQGLQLPDSIASAAYRDDQVIFQPVKIRDAPSPLEIFANPDLSSPDLSNPAFVNPAPPSPSSTDHDSKDTNDQLFDVIPADMPSDVLSTLGTEDYTQQAELGIETGSTEQDGIREVDKTVQGPSEAKGGISGLDSDHIWILNREYLVCLQESGLMMVNCKAAQERIIYEKALVCLEEDKGAIQPLLMPMTLELGAVELAWIEENNDLLYSLGFDLRPFGHNTLLVEGIPAPGDNWQGGTLLRNLISEAEAITSGKASHHHQEMARGYARASGQMVPIETQEQAQHLVAEILRCQEPGVSPGGEAVMRLITDIQLIKLFKAT
jgi:DNA mismatch repair protein MutL